ncbi:MAG: hypothetical protein WD513_01320 [Balneolaceae bacterium]
MNTLTKHLEIINLHSKKILNEVSRIEPSLDFVDQCMDMRQEHIDILENLLENNQLDFLPSHQYNDADRLFDEFIDLNESIEKAMKTILVHKKADLALATKKRKAEDGYHLLKNPDTSYYLTDK